MRPTWQRLCGGHVLKVLGGAVAISVLALSAAAAQGAVVAPHAVKPQVVTPQVVTSPASSPAPAPSSTPAPPPYAAPTAPNPAPAPEPSPSPSSGSTPEPSSAPWSPPRYERRPGPSDADLGLDERIDAERAWRRELELEAIARRRGEDDVALRFKYLEGLGREDKRFWQEESPEEMEVNRAKATASKVEWEKEEEENDPLEVWGDGLFAKYGWRFEPATPTAGGPEDAVQALSDWLGGLLGGKVDEEYDPLREK